MLNVVNMLFDGVYYYPPPKTKFLEKENKMNLPVVLKVFLCFEQI